MKEKQTDANGKRKSTRVHRACSNCRKRKQGCEEERPCKRCVDKGIECVEVEQKRKKSRISSDRDSLNVVFEHEHEHEHEHDLCHSRSQSVTPPSTPVVGFPFEYSSENEESDSEFAMRVHRFSVPRRVNTKEQKEIPEPELDLQFLEALSEDSDRLLSDSDMEEIYNSLDSSPSICDDLLPSPDCPQYDTSSWPLGLPLVWMFPFLACLTGSPAQFEPDDYRWSLPYYTQYIQPKWNLLEDELNSSLDGQFLDQGWIHFLDQHHPEELLKRELGHVKQMWMDILEALRNLDTAKVRWSLQQMDENDNCQNPLVFWSSGGRIHYANSAFCKLVGYSLEELHSMRSEKLTKMGAHGLFHPEEMVKILKKQLDAVELPDCSAYQLKTRLSTKNNRDIPVTCSISNVREAPGRPLMTVAHFSQM